MTTQQTEPGRRLPSEEGDSPEPAASGAIEGARRGEPSAVREIATLIRGFARYLSGTDLRSAGASEIDWEDVAQEASRKFFAAGIHQYRGGNERSYVYTVVKSTWIQLVRSALRRRGREKQVAADALTEAPRPPEAVMKATVERILARLDGSCRELLERAFLDGVTYPELSAAMGLAESSVRSKVSRCIRRARELCT